MPIGGATAKIEAAAEAGIKKVLLPKSNMDDVMLEKKYEDMIEIIPIETIEDVLENILINGSKKERLIKKMREISGAVTSKVSTDSMALSNPSHN